MHGGATEMCDGKDNNCDGQVDEGCEVPPEQLTPEVYEDGTDDDGDGSVPCADPDCEDVPPCCRHWVCGLGVGGMLPMMLLGLGLMRFGVGHRRRGSRDE